jgi:hypothetical protein
VSAELVNVENLPVDAVVAPIVVPLIEPPVITMLAGLMIDYKVGVTIFKQYQLTEVSNDFFEDDEG